MSGRKRVRGSSPPPYTKEAPSAKKRGIKSESKAVKQPAEYEGVHRLVVGVDFGTTYTGISWVSTEGATTRLSMMFIASAIGMFTYCTLHLTFITPLKTDTGNRPGPGRDGDLAWKAPSRIAYAIGNLTSATSNSWGFESTKFDDPSLGKSEDDGVLAKPHGKSAVDLCADYLTEVAIFAHASLEKRITKEILKATPVDFWFTVPAVWSDKAKYDTLRAATIAFKQAKIALHPASRLFLVCGPEAAAIATMSHLTKGGSEVQIGPGDNISICDCGGGTVDVTSYKIDAIVPKLTFEELVPGTGGKCGSTYIDREFIKWMTVKFGPAYTKLGWEKRGPASRFMKDFEGFERDFKVETSSF